MAAFSVNMSLEDALLCDAQRVEGSFEKKTEKQLNSKVSFQKP